jgi:hypothetical protein
VSNQNKEKNEKELLQEISDKLDNMLILMKIQNIEDKDDKISLLKKMNLKSNEVAIIVNMTDNGVRSSKGWKRK